MIKRLARPLLVGTLLLDTGCAEKGRAPDSSAVAVGKPSHIVALARGDSARAAAQRFYDWYLATQAKGGRPYDSLVTSRHDWLADTLATALRIDLDMQRADTLGEIASLSAEADVFLNSHDSCSRYTARSARPLGAGSFAVAVAGDCSGLDKAPNIEVQMRPRGAGWEIISVKDPTDPSFDLLSAFVRYRADMRAQSDSGVSSEPHAGPD